MLGLGLGTVAGRCWALEAARPRWAAGMAPAWQVAAGLGGPAGHFSLPSPSLYQKNKEIKEGKREKRRLEEEFGHGGNFYGLRKMCTVGENRKGQV